VALLLIVPGGLLALTNRMFDSQPQFNRVALALLGIFPFTTMFLVTSVAMLRERTSGTLERLLTTPMSKLDLLLGYGIAFAVAAAAQASVTCAVAYWLLGLYTPGSPALVVAVAIVSAVMGTTLGLFSSAFATSEFQAVQFMPAIVMPQVLLGGLFVPREQMDGFLKAVSDALPLTYDIDALAEVGRTSLVTATLVGDVAVMVGTSAVALALAASTLRRCQGPLRAGPRRAVASVAVVACLAVAVVAVVHAVDAGRYVHTDNAQVDGDRIPVVAPVSGRLVGWRAPLGTALRRDEVVGSIEIQGDPRRGRRPVRSPGDGTVARATATDGGFVTAGTGLAVAYDLAAVYVTARVDETDVGDVHLGRAVDVLVDAYPGTPLTGYVGEIRGAAAATLDPSGQPDNATGVYQRLAQVIPVTVEIPDRRGLTLLPGMNATVKIHK
jgi:ABC-2 type transport system permease protein